MFFGLFDKAPASRPIPDHVKRTAPPGWEWQPDEPLKDNSGYIYRMHRKRRSPSMLLQVAGIIGGLIIFGLGLMMLMATAAKAQTIPLANVEVECRRLGPDAQNLCIRHEQLAYDYVNYIWMDLTPSNRQFCMRFVGDPFMRYQRMAQCTWRMVVTQQSQSPMRFRPLDLSQ